MALPALKFREFVSLAPAARRSGSVVILRPSFYRRAGKRLFDLVVGLPLLLIALPIVLVLAVAVIVDSGWPAFYRAERLGREGQTFRMWKLRTMVKDADAMPRRWRKINPRLAEVYFEGFKLKDDPRVTRVGRLLRRTSLDELPQIWNVARGEMSLVGPRPIVADEMARYGDLGQFLLTVPPGMTGPWQVSGRNAIAYPLRAEIDIDYVATLSLAGDLRLLLQTARPLRAMNGV